MKEKKLDTKNLNSVIILSKKILKVMYILLIAALILTGIFIFQKLKLANIILETLSLATPLFIGIIIAWLFDPIVKKLNKKGITSGYATGIIYIVSIIVIALLAYLLIPAFISQIKEFIKLLPNMINDVKDKLDHILVKGNGMDLSGIKNDLYIYLNNLSTTLTKTAPQNIISVGKSLLHVLFNLGLGIIVGFYLLLDFSKLSHGIKDLLPHSWEKGYSELTHRINTSLRGYVQGVFVVMLLVFVTQSIGMTIAGLNTPLVFAFFCAITDIIPYFGPYIGAIPAVIVAFTQGPITGIAVVVAILIVQMLENYFYQPIIMGNKMSLHPVTIMLGLLICGKLFGIPGMIFATPLIATLKIIIKYIDEKYDTREKLSNIDKEEA